MAWWKRLFGIPAATAPGRVPARNEPCWCGSGDKYKRCHLESDLAKARARGTASCATT
jgi:uncharacterized protein YecA (UPF0149 family)